MSEHEREPSSADIEDESPEESPGEAKTPPEGQQEKSGDSENTLSPDEKNGG
jgi:hypothetical protein